MHPPHVRQAAEKLIAEGVNDCEISRRLGIPRGTIRDWRRPTYVPRQPELRREICPRCWRAARPIRFTADDYSQLLGVYLGDGCISEHPRTQRMRIHLDARYPRIQAEVTALLRRCFPANAVTTVRPSPSSWSGRSDTWAILSLYCSHLECLFPQHGLGKKHERPIVLEPWQAEIVDAAPWPFIRGCIWTDGCSFINRTDVHRPQPYEYLSYEFSNMSADIVELFLRACEGAGVVARANRSRQGVWHVRINRRPSVELMRRHVGVKA